MDEVDYFAEDIDLFAAEPITPRKKPGSPAVRNAAAREVRRMRAMFHALQGGWTRKGWNWQCKYRVRDILRTNINYEEKAKC